VKLPADDPPPDTGETVESEEPSHAAAGIPSLDEGQQAEG